MPVRLTPEGDESPIPSRKIWLAWLQQSTSVVYLVGGGFLLYQYWANLRREMMLITGVLFIAFGVYRFVLVTRAIRRR